MAQAVGEGSGEPFRNLRPAPGSLSRSSPSSESVYNLKQNKALLIPSNRIEIGTHPKQPSCRRGGRAGPRVERRPPSGRAWTCACAACGTPASAGSRALRPAEWAPAESGGTVCPCGCSETSYNLQNCICANNLAFCLLKVTILLHLLGLPQLM